MSGTHAGRNGLEIVIADEGDGGSQESRLKKQPAKDAGRSRKESEKPMSTLAMTRGELPEPVQRRLILLVEDEPDMAQEVALQLGERGYDVKIANTEAAGLEAARSDAASLMIVDRMLHGVDSLAMIETLRSEGLQAPVLFVSALASVDERIHGLKAGGDDYITKPFNMGELSARVEALLRRSTAGRATTLRVGPLELDLIERRAMRDKRELSLLPREFKLLEYLMRHPNQIVTRTMLLEDVWNYRFLPQTNLVDVHIGKIRRKVDGPGEIPLIECVRRAGFMLHAAD
jgi:two-component system, OmpR family, response regulator